MSRGDSCAYQCAGCVLHCLNVLDFCFGVSAVLVGAARLANRPAAVVAVLELSVVVISVVIISTVLAVRFGNCQILNIQFRNHEVHSIFLRPCEQFVALFSFDPVLFRYCHERKDRRTAW